MELAEVLGYLALGLVIGTFCIALEGLLPFMTRRKLKRGEILFRKHELACEMFSLLTSDIEPRELGRTIVAGVVLAEIGMFSPERRRSATPVCATDGEPLAMSADQVRALTSRTRSSASTWCS
jgi:CRP-like cAMP-binding protein